MEGARVIEKINKQQLGLMTIPDNLGWTGWSERINEYVQNDAVSHAYELADAARARPMVIIKGGGLFHSGVTVTDAATFHKMMRALATGYDQSGRLQIAYRLRLDEVEPPLLEDQSQEIAPASQLSPAEQARERYNNDVQQEMNEIETWAQAIQEERDLMTEFPPAAVMDHAPTSRGFHTSSPGHSPGKRNAPIGRSPFGRNESFSQSDTRFDAQSSFRRPLSSSFAINVAPPPINGPYKTIVDFWNEERPHPAHKPFVMKLQKLGCVDMGHLAWIVQRGVLEQKNWKVESILKAEEWVHQWGTTKENDPNGTETQRPPRGNFTIDESEVVVDDSEDEENQPIVIS